jgi:alpha-mannosidase
MKTAGNTVNEIVQLEVDVDWHETERFLKVAMPTTIATERWAAETQFGPFYRATHSNTSWDAAKFEACAHRWAHIGEPESGVAVTNGHSYGHEVRRTSDASGRPGTRIRLSLLRAPLYPDPQADQGRHLLRNALVIGASIGDAVAAGYAVADAERPVRGSVLLPLVTSSNPAVVLDTVKLAEDGSGDVIARFYESRGGQTTSDVGIGFEYRVVHEVDLLERGTGVVADQSGPLSLGLSPFEITTLQIVRA